MKIKNTLPTLMAIIFIIISLVSCQEDFSTLGSDVIGGQDISVTLNNSSTVISYSKKLGPVRTDRLPAYQLGTYNDPVYGKSKFELVSQVSLRTTDPDFGFGSAVTRRQFCCASRHSAGPPARTAWRCPHSDRWYIPRRPLHLRATASGFPGSPGR